MNMIANSHDKSKHLPVEVGVEKTQAGGYVGWSRKLTSKKGFSGKTVHDRHSPRGPNLNRRRHIFSQLEPLSAQTSP